MNVCTCMCVSQEILQHQSAPSCSAHLFILRNREKGGEGGWREKGVGGRERDLLHSMLTAILSLFSQSDDCSHECFIRAAKELKHKTHRGRAHSNTGHITHSPIKVFRSHMEPTHTNTPTITNRNSGE